MKQGLICMIAICLFGLSIFVSAAEVKNQPDKGVTAAIADDVKEVKTSTVKAVQGSKEAIANDFRKMQETVPKDFKDAKEEAIKKSKEVKKDVTQEFKDIKTGLSKPVK